MPKARGRQALSYTRICARFPALRESRAPMKKFFHELLRRDVFKVAAIYVIVAWLLVQVAIAVAPALLLPEWTDTLVIFLLGLGFPVALLLAWAYDLSPKGVTPTQPETAAETVLPASDAPTIGAAVAVDDVPFLPPERSIAVLPFVNMSSDEDQEYFSDGISEELLNGLAKIGAFRVAARTSSFAYKGKEQDISEIGKALNVGHVLEGSVRKAADKVRITAQLIVTETGFHLWSDTYDRALEDVFAIQDEISAAIVNALREHILGEVPTLALTQKVDVRAYELYLQGRQLVDKRGPANIEKGKALFEEALTIAPNYIPALTGLAETHLLLSNWWVGLGGGTPIEIALKSAKSLLDKAVVIDPRSAEVHSTLAQYYNQADDVATAAEHVEIALQANPNYAPTYSRQHFSRVFMGNPHLNAISSLRRMIELDPTSISSLFNMAFRMGDRLNQEEADKALNAVIDVDERKGILYSIRADIANHRGDTAEALDLCHEGRLHVETKSNLDGIIHESRGILRDPSTEQVVDSSVIIGAYICGADKQSILARCKHFAEQDYSGYSGLPAFQMLLDGWGGNEAQARTMLESHFKVDGWGPMFMLNLVAVVPPMLADLRRKAGDEAGAQLVIGKLKEYYKIEGQHPDGHHMTFDLLGAAIAMLDGDKELAFERLQKQFDRVWYVVTTVRANPLYEPLHDDPRYDALNAAVDKRVEEELAKVKELGLLPYEAWLTPPEAE